MNVNQSPAIILDLKRGSYPIYIENHMIKKGLIKSLIDEFDGQECIVITDANVYRLYATILPKDRVIVVPDGESTKQINVYTEVVEKLATLNLNRQSRLIAFGGGVVGDLAGFVAATYMRGISYIQVPTSLLAMVDSSIGGKVALNLNHGKNMIGSFYQPEAVYIDPSLLLTLDLKEWINGMAEIVKYAVGFDRNLYNLLKENTLETLMSDEATITQIIRACVKIKCQIVTEDELDKGIRNFLNFGHTLGHAIETYYNYSTYKHGEAVAIGMYLKIKFAFESSLVSKAVFDEISEIYQNYQLPTYFDSSDSEAVFELMARDKKRITDAVEWIRFEGIGHLAKGRDSLSWLISTFTRILDEVVKEGVQDE